MNRITGLLRATHQFRTEIRIAVMKISLTECASPQRRSKSLQRVSYNTTIYMIG